MQGGPGTRRHALRPEGSGEASAAAWRAGLTGFLWAWPVTRGPTTWAGQGSRSRSLNRHPRAVLWWNAMNAHSQDTASQADGGGGLLRVPPSPFMQPPPHSPTRQGGSGPLRSHACVRVGGGVTVHTQVLLCPQVLLCSPSVLGGCGHTLTGVPPGAAVLPQVCVEVKVATGSQVCLQVLLCSPGVCGGGPQAHRCAPSTAVPPRCAWRGATGSQVCPRCCCAPQVCVEGSDRLTGVPQVLLCSPRVRGGGGTGSQVCPQVLLCFPRCA